MWVPMTQEEAHGMRRIAAVAVFTIIAIALVVTGALGVFQHVRWVP